MGLFISRNSLFKFLRKASFLILFSFPFRNGIPKIPQDYKPADVKAQILKQLYAKLISLILNCLLCNPLFAVTFQCFQRSFYTLFAIICSIGNKTAKENFVQKNMEISTMTIDLWVQLISFVPFVQSAMRIYSFMAIKTHQNKKLG